MADVHSHHILGLKNPRRVVTDLRHWQPRGRYHPQLVHTRVGVDWQVADAEPLCPFLSRGMFLPVRRTHQHLSRPNADMSLINVDIFRFGLELENQFREAGTKYDGKDT
jgi:hypothetical protein